VDGFTRVRELDPKRSNASANWIRSVLRLSEVARELREWHALAALAEWVSTRGDRVLAAKLYARCRAATRAAGQAASPDEYGDRAMDQLREYFATPQNPGVIFISELKTLEDRADYRELKERVTGGRTSRLGPVNPKSPPKK
jgi:hypothetical protein